MWKEIAIIFLVLFIVRFIIDTYIKITYNQVVNQFYSREWKGLENRIIKQRRICNVFSNGPFNKTNRQIYNGLCFLLASIAFVKNDNTVFENELNNVKREDQFAIKPFLFALYYLTKHDEEIAKRYYEKYQSCKQKDENTKIIMEYLFQRTNGNAFNDAVKSFRNPAIQKMLAEINCQAK